MDGFPVKSLYQKFFEGLSADLPRLFLEILQHSPSHFSGGYCAVFPAAILVSRPGVVI